MPGPNRKKPAIPEPPPEVNVHFTTHSATHTIPRALALAVAQVKMFFGSIESAKRQMKMSHFSLLVASTPHASNILCRHFGFTEIDKDAGIGRHMLKDVAGQHLEINQCRSGQEPQGHIGFMFETRDAFWEKYTQIEDFLDLGSLLSRDLLTKRCGGKGSEGCVSLTAKCGLKLELTWGKDFVKSHENRPNIKRLPRKSGELQAAA